MNTFGQSRLAVVVSPRPAAEWHPRQPGPLSRAQSGRGSGPARPGRSALRTDLRRLARPRGHCRLRARPERRRSRRDGARHLSPGRGSQRLAVECPGSRSVSEPPPDGDDSGGPPHQGVSVGVIWSCPPIATRSAAPEVVHDPSTRLDAGARPRDLPCRCPRSFGSSSTRRTTPTPLLRYAQLQQQYAQLVTTYQQIRTQYLLLQQQAQRLPFDMTARYRSLASPWLPFTAPNAYGTTTPWIRRGEHRPGSVRRAYTRATQPLLSYAGAIARLSADEAARVRDALRPRAARGRQRHPRPRSARIPARPSAAPSRPRSAFWKPTPTRPTPTSQYPDRGAQQNQRDGRHVSAPGQRREQRPGVAAGATTARGDGTPRSGGRKASTLTSRFSPRRARSWRVPPRRPPTALTTFRIP